MNKQKDLAPIILTILFFAVLGFAGYIYYVINTNEAVVPSNPVLTIPINEDEFENETLYFEKTVLESDVVDVPENNPQDKTLQTTEYSSGICVDDRKYIYDVDIEACIPNSGLSEDERRAAKIAVSFLYKEWGGYNDLTVISVSGSDGSFNVSLEEPDNINIGVSIREWEVGNWGDAADNILFIN